MIGDRELEHGPWTPVTVRWDERRKVAVISRDGNEVLVRPEDGPRLSADLLDLTEPRRRIP
jgi:hypothetical protein